MRTLGLASVAVLLACWSCASTRAVPRPYPGGAAPAPPGVVGTKATARASAASVALSLLGRPYRNGGADPDGFDCSGLVQYAFARAGFALPRSVRQQAGLGVAVPDEAIVPGDLLFFAIDGRTISHVGIATGLDRFVHAPSSRGVVREERLSADYWHRRFAGARRVGGE